MLLSFVLPTAHRKAVKRNFALKTITSMCSCLKSGACFLKYGSRGCACVWSASLCLISQKTRWFKNRSSIRLLSMRVLKMSKVLLRSLRLMRRLVGAFRKRPIKLKTALVKAQSFSAVTCDLKTRQQELQRKTPPITLDSMHSALRCAALSQGTCFRCWPNQGLGVTSNRLIGQKVCLEALFSRRNTGTSLCGVIPPKQAPRPTSRASRGHRP